MEYFNDFIDYIKSMLNIYIFTKQEENECTIPTKTTELVQEEPRQTDEIDKKIGNLNDIINILNELKPIFLKNLTNSKKKHKFTIKLIDNINEINYVLKYLEKWRSENDISNVRNISVQNIITNTNMDFLYKKMLLIKERYEILNNKTNSNFFI